MKRILLLTKHKSNTSKLYDFLSIDYPVTIADNGELNPQHEFDLCILDNHSLAANKDVIIKYKKKVEPLLLPFLLFENENSLREPVVKLYVVDEIIRTPVKMLELRARVENLLRARQFTIQLQDANKELSVKNLEIQNVNKNNKAIINQNKTLIKIIANDLRKPLAQIIEAVDPNKELVNMIHEDNIPEFRENIFQRASIMLKIIDDYLDSKEPKEVLQV